MVINLPLSNPFLKSHNNVYEATSPHSAWLHSVTSKTANPTICQWKSNRDRVVGSDRLPYLRRGRFEWLKLGAAFTVITVIVCKLCKIASCTLYRNITRRIRVQTIGTKAFKRLSGSNKVKVKLSLYRPSRPLELMEVEAPKIFRQSAHEGGKVVTPTRRPPLPLGMIRGAKFCQGLSQPQDHRADGRGHK